MPRVQDAIPSLDCRAWKGHSNPLLLTPLRFAPESRRSFFALFRDLANERKRFGYRRLFILLRQEGEPPGINRIYRLYREEGLTVRKRRARRRAVGVRAP